jgi:uncharacterized lipoprotein NlpE involved in copper resistance
MRKIFTILAALIAFVLVSCNNYGKKVKIDDTMEVYLKGDSVNEAQAKKLGTYLANLWKEAKNQKSFQLSKDSGVYVVKMVVDEEKIKQDSTADVGFMALKTLLESEVFDNKQVKFVVTDNTFKDIKSY